MTALSPPATPAERRLPVAGVTITLAAAVQAIGVVPAVGRGPGGLLVPAVVSGVTIALSLAVTAAWVVSGSADTFTGPRRALLAWSAGAVLLVTVLLAVLPPALPLALILLPAVLVAVAARRPLRDAVLVWRRAPVRAVVWAALTVVLALVTWLVAVVLGLIGAGVAGAFGWWLLAGVVQVRVLRGWAAVYAS